MGRPLAAVAHGAAEGLRRGGVQKVQRQAAVRRRAGDVGARRGDDDLKRRNGALAELGLQLGLGLTLLAECCVMGYECNQCECG